MSAWNDIQDSLNTAERADYFSPAAKGAREHIRNTVFELEAKAEERDHLRKMLSESRAEVTRLELALERREDRWSADLDAAHAAWEEQHMEAERAAQDELIEKYDKRTP